MFCTKVYNNKMTTRARKEEIRYRKTMKKRAPSKECTFCHINDGHEEFIEEGTFFKIIVNLFRYTYWDEQDVVHQVMLVPKLHTESIRKLPTEAAIEFLDFIGKYEEQGYNIYARPPMSATKSVPHQHTHLIKTSGKRKKVMVYSRKPFIMFAK